MLVTLDELCDATATVSRCLRLLIRVGLILAAIGCYVCGQDMVPRKTNDKRFSLDDGWCFYCCRCHRKHSIRTGSIFNGSPKTLRNWVQMLWMFVHMPEITTGSASKRFGRERHSTGRWYRHFRKCISKWMSDNFTQLGSDFIVEIDESDFSKKCKYNRGNRRRTKRWVFGMIERVSGRCKFVVVPDREPETLLQIILEHVSGGATIFSDMFGAYWTLGDYGFMHQMVNHSGGFRHGRTGVHTDTIEGVWMHAKRSLNLPGGTRDPDIQLKLDEFAFRKSFLKWDTDKFAMICNVIAECWNQVE